MTVWKSPWREREAMKYFPLFADLDGAGVLVVGGGEQAAQKVRLLAKTNAHITVVAEAVTEELSGLAQQGALTVVPRAFRADDVDGQRLVYSATGDRALDAIVAAAARARGVPVNVVDAPELSTFITPAIVDRAPVTVAIGTEGAAPVLAREIKTRLESWLPANLGALATRAQILRATVADSIPDGRARRRVWERLLQGPFRRAVLSGAESDAARIFQAEISGSAAPAVGRVYLIGCGPGDPDLLTLKALQRMQEADVLVIDRLVNPKILDYARRDAERIHVGKTPGRTSTSQSEINRILVREAAAGKVVARLKGGDPLIFGRAAEEMAALQAAHISVEVIPGITTAHACAARVGLPVTLREQVRQFSVVTGTTAHGEPELDWVALAAKGSAFSIYMGVGNAPVIRRNLLSAGAKPETPVVIVENGTQERERSFAATLHDLTDCVDQRHITGPAVIFVGLDWQDAGLRRPETVIVHRRRLRPSGSRRKRQSARRPSYEQERGKTLGLDSQPARRRNHCVPRFRGRLERVHHRGGRCRLPRRGQSAGGPRCLRLRAQPRGGTLSHRGPRNCGTHRAHPLPRARPRRRPPPSSTTCRVMLSPSLRPARPPPLPALRRPLHLRLQRGVRGSRTH
ncbi:MAG: uroporphyrinogen-III C-methyltransferase [Rhodospirillales bacterium]|nr:uroporphyrinogen-III C-methyltransferase [Rhodospirillales bacterium]